MESANVGSYLSERRRAKELTLDEVAARMGKDRLSKQALSLIERGKMRIPNSRLMQIKNAYGLNRTEQKELEHLYAFEKLVEHTGYDVEFGEAVLSLVDPTRAVSIHIIGGKALTLNSHILQARAAEFLQPASNKLIFIEPDFGGLLSQDGPTWSSTSRTEMAVIRDSIQSFAKRAVGEQIEFYQLKAVSAGHDGLLLQALSLCSPFTATTIASSSQEHALAGYVYVEGPKDRWVLLKIDHARRVHHIATRLIERAHEHRGVIKVSLQ